MNDRPLCIVVAGRPGSGKTTLAKRLGERLSMPVISRDEIKEGYVNTFGVPHDRLPDANAVVSALFFDVMSQYLVHRVSIVVEAAFQHAAWEPHIPSLCQSSRLRIVVCDIDAMVAARRHLQRGLDDPRREFYHGDKRVAIYRETGELGTPGPYTPPAFDVPTLHVSTDADYVPGLDAIVAWVKAPD